MDSSVINAVINQALHPSNIQDRSEMLICKQVTGKYPCKDVRKTDCYCQLGTPSDAIKIYILILECFDSPNEQKVSSWNTGNLFLLCTGGYAQKISMFLEATCSLWARESFLNMSPAWPFHWGLCQRKKWKMLSAKITRPWMPPDVFSPGRWKYSSDLKLIRCVGSRWPRLEIELEICRSQHLPAVHVSFGHRSVLPAPHLLQTRSRTFMTQQESLCPC